MSTPENQVPTTAGLLTIPLGMTDTSSDSASVASKATATRKAPATPRKRTPAAASSSTSGWKTQHPPALVQKCMAQDTLLTKMNEALIETEATIKEYKDKKPGLKRALDEAQAAWNANEASIEHHETILAENRVGFENILALKIAKLKK